MKCDTGNIYTSEELEKMLDKDKSFDEVMKERDMIEMKLPPTQQQMNRTPPRVGRNDPCPCGSGKKFKKCHLIIKD